MEFASIQSSREWLDIVYLLNHRVRCQLPVVPRFVHLLLLSPILADLHYHWTLLLLHPFLRV